MCFLHALHTFCDGYDSIPTFLQLGRDDGLHICFLLKDETRQECGDFFRFIICQCILENELSQDELIGRVDLGGETVTIETMTIVI